MPTSDVEVCDVHYNDDGNTHQHITHPPGWIMSVYLPNSQTTCEAIPSEFLFNTYGSVQALNNLLYYSTRPRRAQHCAHFFLNNVCTRGSMCNFIHAMKPPVITPLP
jgi:hypothetical protein